MSAAAAGAIAALLHAHRQPMPLPRACSLAAAGSLRASLRGPAATAPPSSSCLSLLRLHSARSISSCGARASPGGAVSASEAEQEKQTQSELIFLGTGTSEGIPRVCTEAAELGNWNRRRSTSILLRYATPFGTSNILVESSSTTPCSSGSLLLG